LALALMHGVDTRGLRAIAPSRDHAAMAVTNTKERYGVGAIGLHWIMAGLILILVALGLYMVRLPDVGFDAKKITSTIIHKEIGVLVFAFAGVRLVWRQLNPLPALADTLPEWQKVIAIVVHLCFYALMLALPVTGLVMSSAAGIPVTFLDLFTIPDLVPPSQTLFEKLRELHDWLGYTMGVLICIHASAALRHHFILRDGSLRKMLGT
jgi:cytochrome b561